MKKNKIDKKKFLFKFLENFSSSSDLDETIIITLSKMKISKDKIQEVRTEILPNGFKSLMMEVNQIINERLRSEKTPKNFKTFRTHEKGTIMGFTHRSRIQQQIVSRRRTQYSSKEVEANKHTTVGGNVSNNKTSQATSTGQALERNTTRSMGKT